LLQHTIGPVDEGGWRSQASENQLKEMGLQRKLPVERSLALLAAPARRASGNDPFAAMCAAGAAPGHREALPDVRRGIAAGKPAGTLGESHAASL
jgi:hypothetical protein